MRVIDTVIVSKTGTGTDDDPIRPDTAETRWQVIDESDTQFTIEILGD